MIIVNGTDLATLGVIARGRAALPLGIRSPRTVSIPGGYPVRTGEEIAAGKLTIDGALLAADHDAVLANVDALALLLRGECVIRLDDYPDREWVGYLEDASKLALHDPAWVQRSGALSLAWTLPDPRARARVETVRTGSGALVLGSAPSEIRVEATGLTDATVRVRAGGSAGTILTELVWSGAAGALVIDTETATISVDGANAIDGMTAASVFPVADPAEGADYIEVSAGATVRYRRRW